MTEVMSELCPNPLNKLSSSLIQEDMDAVDDNTEITNIKENGLHISVKGLVMAEAKLGESTESTCALVGDNCSDGQSSDSAYCSSSDKDKLDGQEESPMDIDEDKTNCDNELNKQHFSKTDEESHTDKTILLSAQSCKAAVMSDVETASTSDSDKNCLNENSNPEVDQQKQSNEIAQTAEENKEFCSNVDATGDCHPSDIKVAKSPEEGSRCESEKIDAKASENQEKSLLDCSESKPGLTTNNSYQALDHCELTIHGGSEVSDGSISSPKDELTKVEEIESLEETKSVAGVNPETDEISSNCDEMTLSSDVAMLSESKTDKSSTPDDDKIQSNSLIEDMEDDDIALLESPVKTEGAVMKPVVQDVLSNGLTSSDNPCRKNVEDNDPKDMEIDCDIKKVESKHGSSENTEDVLSMPDNNSGNKSEIEEQESLKHMETELNGSPICSTDTKNADKDCDNVGENSSDSSKENNISSFTDEAVEIESKLDIEGGPESESIMHNTEGQIRSEEFPALKDLKNKEDQKEKVIENSSCESNMSKVLYEIPSETAGDSFALEVKKDEAKCEKNDTEIVEENAVPVDTSTTVKDNVTETIEDKDTKSVEDNDTKILEGKDTKLIEDKDTKLIEDKDTKLVEDKDTKPVEDKDTKLVEDKDTKLVEDNDTKTVEDNDTKTVEDNDTKTVKENDSETIEDNTPIRENINAAFEENGRIEICDDLEKSSKENCESDLDDEILFVDESNGDVKKHPETGSKEHEDKPESMETDIKEASLSQTENNKKRNISSEDSEYVAKRPKVDDSGQDTITQFPVDNKKEEPTATNSKDDLLDSSEPIKAITPEVLQGFVKGCVKLFLKKRKQDQIDRMNRQIKTMQSASTLWKETAKHLEKSVGELTSMCKRLEKRQSHATVLKNQSKVSVAVQVCVGEKIRTLPLLQPESPKKAPDPPKIPGGSTLSLPPSVLLNPPASFNNQVQKSPTTMVGGSPNLRPHGPSKMTPPQRQMAPKLRFAQNTQITSPKPQPPRPYLNNNPAQIQNGRTAGPPTNNTVNLIDLTDEEESSQIRRIPSNQVPKSIHNSTSNALKLSDKAKQMSGPMNGLIQQSNSQTIANNSSAVLVSAGNSMHSGPQSKTQMIPSNVNMSAPPGSQFQLVSVSHTPGNKATLNSGSMPLFALVPSPPHSHPSAPNIQTPTSAATFTSYQQQKNTGKHTATSLPQGPGKASSHSLPPSVHINPQKHPAPLPAPPNVVNVPSFAKKHPPKPGLKISRVAQGIVLSWNMPHVTEAEVITSYQLFAYQESDNVLPSTHLWKKVGDVKALPLPMACTLTQFQEGNKYHFAVRAVDQYGRCGPYSDPSTIFLGPNK